MGPRLTELSPMSTNVRGMAWVVLSVSTNNYETTDTIQYHEGCGMDDKPPLDTAQ